MNIVIDMTAALLAVGAFITSTAAYADPRPIDGWVAAVNKKLDQRTVLPDDGQYGIAHATFQRGPDGTPTAIQIQSSNRALARAAHLTLKRLRNLPPMPEGYAGTRIRMQMLIGETDDVRGYYKQRASLLASAEARNAKVFPGQRSTQLAQAKAR